MKLSKFAPKKKLNEGLILMLNQVVDNIDRLVGSKYAFSEEYQLKKYELEMAIYDLLTDFWKRYDIDIKLIKPKEPKLTGYTMDRLEKDYEKHITKLKDKEMKRKQRVGGAAYTPPFWFPKEALPSQKKKK